MLLRMREPQGGLTDRSFSGPCAYMGISGTGNRRKGTSPRIHTDPSYHERNASWRRGQQVWALKNSLADKRQGV